MHADRELIERIVSADMARADMYFFARWMFRQRRGYQWQRAPHHKLVCDALMRVFRGECRRLIINVPPRYSKTELAVINFIAWALGKVPDSEFIHVSYSGALAINNSSQIRSLVQHEAYGEVFPGVRLAGEAAHHWKTTAGGVMYATGAGGTITGFGAGKMREGFGGCFPAGTRVWTDRGLLPIDRIVRERMAVQSWAFDYAGRMTLRPVVGWHENPPNAIVRVTCDDGAVVECTPDHRFWTINRGWVRADSLREDDRLPRVNGGIEGFHNVGVNAESLSGRPDAEAVFAMGAPRPVVEGQVGLLGSELGSVVGALAPVVADIGAAGHRSPGVAAPDRIDHGDCDAKAPGDVFCGFADGGVDGRGLIVGQDCAGVPIGLAERAVGLAVGNVGRAAVISKVAEAVVGGVSVGVAGLGPIWAGTDESSKHESVHLGVLDARAAGEADTQVPAGLDGRLQDLPRQFARVAAAAIDDGPRLASDSAKAADGIVPFVAGYRSPALIEFVRHDASTFCLTVQEHHNFTVERGFVVKNCIIVDDPHKADEARSDVVRAGVIEWFRNTLESRRNAPQTPIVLVMQRLHEDDLAGWLLRGGNGEEWEHLCLSAWADEDAGLPLWPEKHSAEDLRRMELASPYTFAGQYRQLPAPPSGGIFRPAQLVIVDAIPAGAVEWVRGWDLASLDGAGDWTAGAKLGRYPDGRYVIADMVRVQEGPDARDRTLTNTAALDGVHCRISIPQDPGQAGRTQVLDLTRKLAGRSVRSSPEGGDKITRAEPFASQVNVGNVMMLRAAWNDAVIEEMRNFPNGRHDDQIDALSRAFAELLGVPDPTPAGLKVQGL